MIEYESHMMVRGLYNASMKGRVAIDPTHYVFRFTLKYVCDLVPYRRMALMIVSATCSPQHLVIAWIRLKTL